MDVSNDEGIEIGPTSAGFVPLPPRCDIHLRIPQDDDPLHHKGRYTALREATLPAAIIQTPPHSESVRTPAATAASHGADANLAYQYSQLYQVLDRGQA